LAYAPRNAKRDSEPLRARARPGMRARCGTLVRAADEPAGHDQECRMNPRGCRLVRWDELALDKVTEMVSRKIVAGEHELLAQDYLKRGAQVPLHRHASEQMTYVLQGSLRFRVGGQEVTVRDGEVLHIPPDLDHQAEALDDTFSLDVFSPPR